MNRDNFSRNADTNQSISPSVEENKTATLMRPIHLVVLDIDVFINEYQDGIYRSTADEDTGQNENAERNPWINKLDVYYHDLMVYIQNGLHGLQGENSSHKRLSTTTKFDRRDIHI